MTDQPKSQLTGHQIRQIAVQARMSERTVRRAVDGGSVTESTLWRIGRAMDELKMDRALCPAVATGAA